MFRVSARVPVYRFVLDSSEGRAVVVARLRRAIDRPGISGAVEENDFAFRPRATWFGSGRSRPRVQGHVSAEREGTSVHVAVRTDPWAWGGAFASMAVFVFGALEVSQVPLWLCWIAALSVGGVITLMSHLAEGSRTAAWLGRVVAEDRVPAKPA